MSDPIYAYGAPFFNPGIDIFDRSKLVSETDSKASLEDEKLRFKQAFIENKENLKKLLDAITDLKGQTKEIYNLKAMAFAIKASL